MTVCENYVFGVGGRIAQSGDGGDVVIQICLIVGVILLL
jgi:hypothetical protein